VAPAGGLTLMTPAQPEGLVAPISSAKRYPLLEPPARMSSVCGGGALTKS